VTLQPTDYPQGRVAWILAAVFLAYFTSNYFISTSMVAMPHIAAELDGMPLFSWAIAIPALLSALTTLIFAKLSDLFGRRLILLVSLAAILVGAVLSALCHSFVFLIFGLSVIGLGQGAVQPLCFTVLGDMFEPARRNRWAGLLNLSSGAAALFGPSLAGWLVDQLTWRLLFWLLVPLALLSAAAILFSLPRGDRTRSHPLDLGGASLLAVATSTLIVGLCLGGGSLPWLSFPVLGLIGTSLLFWLLFLRSEAGQPEPILDPHLAGSRVFLTAALAALLSFFGLTAISTYFPLFLQGVQGASATLSGQVITPYSFLISFMGVPTGLALARLRRYKWMYIAGYGVLAAALFGLYGFTARTASGWGFFVSTVAGLGLGTIPTINTLIVQSAFSKRLLGAATGGIFFFVAMGRAIAPAILGSVLQAARLETSLKSIFLIGAVTMLLSFLLIVTIPEISLQSANPD